MLNFHFQPASLFEYNSIHGEYPFWVTHTKSWTRVIEKSFAHIKGYIAADNTTISPDCSFLPVYRIKKPFKRNSWLSIPYATVSDPVFKTKTHSGPFLKSLINHPLTKNCPLEIRSSFKLSSDSHFSRHDGYFNHQIILNDTEDNVFKRFHRKAVQIPVRKSLSSGITLKVSNSMDDVSFFYKSYTIMRRELGLLPQPYRFFKNMWKELCPDNLELLIAEYNGKPVAGLWILKNQWLYSFEYIARARRNTKLHCAHFLYWNGIKRAINSGISKVSFGRTSAKNESLNLFKQRWGTEITPYYDYKYPIKTEESREDSRMYMLMQKYSPKLPLPIFRLLGEIIYRLV